MLVATAAFAPTARALATFKGFSSLPIFVVPHPFIDLTPDEVAVITDRSRDALLAHLVSKSPRERRGNCIRRSCDDSSECDPEADLDIG